MMRAPLQQLVSRTLVQLDNFQVRSVLTRSSALSLSQQIVSHGSCREIADHDNFERQVCARFGEDGGERLWNLMLHSDLSVEIANYVAKECSRTLNRLFVSNGMKEVPKNPRRHVKDHDFELDLCLKVKKEVRLRYLFDVCCEEQDVAAFLPRADGSFSVRGLRVGLIFGKFSVTVIQEYRPLQKSLVFNGLPKFGREDATAGGRWRAAPEGGDTDQFVRMAESAGKIKSGDVLPEDGQFMQAAEAEAQEALNDSEVPVGCVFVRDSKIIAGGHNYTNIEMDATRHAEMVAIDKLWAEASSSETSIHPDRQLLAGCTLYVTCEPCIMCAAAIGLLGVYLKQTGHRPNPRSA